MNSHNIAEKKLIIDQQTVWNHFMKAGYRNRSLTFRCHTNWRKIFYRIAFVSAKFYKKKNATKPSHVWSNWSRVMKSGSIIMCRWKYVRHSPSNVRTGAKEGDAMRLLGPERNRTFWVVATQQNDWIEPLLLATNRSAASSLGKSSGTNEEKGSYLPAWQYRAMYSFSNPTKSRELRLEVLMYPPYSLYFTSLHYRVFRFLWRVICHSCHLESGKAFQW